MAASSAVLVCLSSAVVLSRSFLVVVYLPLELLMGLGLGLEIGLQGGDLLLDLDEVQNAHRQPGEDGHDQTDSHQHGSVLKLIVMLSLSAGASAVNA